MRIGGENGFRESRPSTASGAVATKDSGAGARAPGNGGDGPSPFARILHGLGRDVDRGEKVVRRAVEGGGKDLGPGELLALQAGVYRYSEAVDLSAKLIDRATSGVKTVLQGQ